MVLTLASASRFHGDDQQANRNKGKLDDENEIAGGIRMPP
jgi:hypothetical protein